MAYLVKFDATAIHSFIFNDDVLKQVRGASALVDTLCRTDAKALINKHRDSQIIFLGGGGGAVRFAQKADAESFMQALRQTYQEKAPGLGFQIVCAPENAGLKLFDQLKQMDRQLAMEDPQGEPCSALPGYLEPCGSCRQQPVVQMLKFDRHLCRSCLAKFEFLNKRNHNEPLFLEAFRDAIGKLPDSATANAWQTVLQSMKQSDPSQADADDEAARPAWEKVFPQGLMDIGELAFRTGYFSLIYADGNRMGSAIEAYLKNTKTGDQAKHYHEFSKFLTKAMEQATFQALFETLPLRDLQLPGFDGPTATPLREITAEWELAESSKQDVGPRYILPFEILLLGGDDLVIMITPELALPFALKLQHHFRKAMLGFKQQDKVNKIEELSLGIGMLTAPHRTPMRRMIQKAESLLDSAKRKSHEMTLGEAKDFEGAIDWMVLTSESNSDLDVLRKQSTALDEGRVLLTHKPYSHKDAKRFEALVSKVSGSKMVPMGPLQAVAESCRESKLKGNLNLLYLLGRLDQVPRNALGLLLKDLNPREQHKIEDFPDVQRIKEEGLNIAEGDDPHIPFFAADPKARHEFSTPLLDLMELLPFCKKAEEVGV